MSLANDEGAAMKLSEVLNRKGKQVFTVPESASVGEAIRTMYQNGVGSVIVPSISGEPLGIITERDIMRLYAEGRVDFERLQVKDCMTTNLVSGKPDHQVQEILAIMTERRFRHLPVVQDGQIIGLISIGDLVKAELHEVTVEAQTLRQYISS
jgi:CBS domain-containing protein